jgi:hypothetical protein
MHFAIRFNQMNVVHRPSGVACVHLKSLQDYTECKCIKRLQLPFIMFPGPSTDTTPAGSAINGNFVDQYTV